jgi:hypothetical protein
MWILQAQKTHQNTCMTWSTWQNVTPAALSKYRTISCTGISQVAPQVGVNMSVWWLCQLWVLIGPPTTPANFIEIGQSWGFSRWWLWRPYWMSRDPQFYAWTILIFPATTPANFIEIGQSWGFSRLWLATILDVHDPQFCADLKGVRPKSRSPVQ